VTSDVDTGLVLYLRARAGGLRFHWSQTHQSPALTSTPIPVQLPADLVEHDAVVDYPLVVNGILRSDASSIPIPSLHFLLDEAGQLQEIEKQSITPYREGLFPKRPRPEATIALDDDGDDTGLIEGVQ
jgi:hypothetical protein